VILNPGDVELNGGISQSATDWYKCMTVIKQNILVKSERW